MTSANSALAPNYHSVSTSGTTTTTTDNGIVTDCGSAKVELAVASDSAFRVSVSFEGTPAALETPMVDSEQPSLAKWTKVTDGEYTGIKTS